MPCHGYLGVAFAHDQFTVADTAKGVDADGQTLASGVGACCAVRLHTTQELRYTLDGTTPTDALGIVVAENTTFDIVGEANVDNLKLIRDTADSATVDCVYFRP